jgi:hypothetical protein
MDDIATAAVGAPAPPPPPPAAPDHASEMAGKGHRAHGKRCSMSAAGERRHKLERDGFWF